MIGRGFCYTPALFLFEFDAFQRTVSFSTGRAHVNGTGRRYDCKSLFIYLCPQFPCTVHDSLFLRLCFFFCSRAFNMLSIAALHIMVIEHRSLRGPPLSILWSATRHLRQHRPSVALLTIPVAVVSPLCCQPPHLVSRSSNWLKRMCVGGEINK